MSSCPDLDQLETDEYLLELRLEARLVEECLRLPPSLMGASHCRRHKPGVVNAPYWLLDFYDRQRPVGWVSGWCDGCGVVFEVTLPETWRFPIMLDGYTLDGETL